MQHNICDNIPAADSISIMYGILRPVYLIIMLLAQ